MKTGRGVQEEWNKKNHEKRWRERNPDRVKFHRDKSNQKRNLNHILRVNDSISSSISTALKGKKSGRHWEDLVGFNLQELITHLESKFEYGMSWENYGRGGWVIDHIIPISFFVKNDPTGKRFRECWSLQNLQPMWEGENARKKDKILL